jgi:D-alanine-D-alanine ligase-like ATP-grasp enzyme
MQRNNNLLSSTAAAEKYNITTKVLVTISFATEKDRVKGVATLIRSPYAFKGIDKNKFIIEKEHLKIFKNTDIEYNIIV